MNGSVKRQYRLRLFRESDREQVYHVFKAAMVHADNSPRKVALRANLRSPSSVFFYTLILLGILSPTIALRKRHMQILSYLFSYLVAFWFIRYWSFFSSKFFVYCDVAFRSDMEDIEWHYKTRSTNDSEQLSPNRFWVVECDVDGVEGTTPKVVACAGLDETTVTDPNSAEIRRMVVSPQYQRQGIASMLIDAILDHARARGLSRVILHVTEYQPDASRLYAKYGWVERSRVPFVLEGYSVMMKEMVLDL